MAYTLKGTYLAACNCIGLCPCPVDQKPSARGGECRGFAAFGVREGNAEGTDLSGVNFALYNNWGSNPSAGNWKIGIVIDSAATDDQATVLTRVLSGELGGPFADFAALITENLGVERDTVTVSGGSASIGSASQARFEPFQGPGGPTTVKGAPFGFAPEFAVGTATGSSSRFGLDFDASYGESADFEYSSEGADQHIRA
jgi:hypothetical protein